MNKSLNITLQVVLWAAIGAYFVFGARECSGRQGAEKLQQVDIAMHDTLNLITPELVRQWLDNAGVRLEGTPLNSINTGEIIGTILAHPLVRQADAWVERSGVLHVRVEQRRPVVRIVRGAGSLYISSDMWVVPSAVGMPQDVAVVTGNFPLPFEWGYYGSIAEQNRENQSEEHKKNLLFLTKLLNFVELVEKDDFWRGEVLQISAEPSPTPWSEPEVELWVRSARFAVRLGTLDDVQAKLDKLVLFYRNVLPHQGWETFAVLDARNRGQIVARRSKSRPLRDTTIKNEI